MKQSVHGISGVRALDELEFRLRKFTRRLIVGDNSSDYAAYKRNENTAGSFRFRDNRV